MGHHSYYTRRLAESLAAAEGVTQVTVVSYGGFRNEWASRPNLRLLQVREAVEGMDWFPALDPPTWTLKTCATLDAASALFAEHDVVQILDCYPRALAQWLRRHRAVCAKAVVLCHNPPLRSLIPPLRALPRGLRTRWQHRGLMPAEDFLINHTTCLVHAETVAEHMRRAYSRARVAVILPGADRHAEPLPSRAEARRLLGLPWANERVILVFGVLAPSKGIQTLLEALAVEPPEVRLLLVGRPVQGWDLPALVAQAGWSDRTIVHGEYIADEQVPLWFRAADAALVAYPRGFIQNSGVLTRAADYETPVIISDVGQMGHLTRQYGLGVLFEPENPLSLRDALHRFVALGEDELARMRQGLTQFAQAHSWPRIAAQHVALYQKVSADNRK